MLEAGGVIFCRQHILFLTSAYLNIVIANIKYVGISVYLDLYFYYVLAVYCTCTHYYIRRYLNTKYVLSTDYVEHTFTILIMSYVFIYNLLLLRLLGLCNFS